MDGVAGARSVPIGAPEELEVIASQQEALEEPEVIATQQEALEGLEVEDEADDQP
jgi:hypothetical protein